MKRLFNSSGLLIGLALVFVGVMTNRKAINGVQRSRAIRLRRTPAGGAWGGSPAADRRKTTGKALLSARKRSPDCYQKKTMLNNGRLSQEVSMMAIPCVIFIPQREIDCNCTIAI